MKNIPPGLNANSSMRPPSPSLATRTPWETPKGLDAWLSQLDAIALNDRPKVEAFLHNVALGRLGGTQEAQAVFNDLIEHEAYEVFVEVFAEYNKIHQAHAASYGQPFKSTLVLQLPYGWKPQSQEKLEKALGAIQVERVQVLPPKPETYRASKDPNWRGVANDEAFGVSSPKSLPIPRSVCACVAALLKAGALELAVAGMLEEDGVVVDAMQASPTFHSLELGQKREGVLLADEDVSCYVRLLSSSPEGKLQALTIHQSNLLNGLRLLIKDEPDRLPVNGQALTSLHLGSCSADAFEDAVWFIQSLSAIPKLTDISLSFSEDPYVPSSVGEQMPSMFTTLQQFTGLEKLELQGGLVDFTEPYGLQWAPMVAALLKNCPKLLSFGWDSQHDFSDGAASAMDGFYKLYKKDFQGGDEGLAHALAHHQALEALNLIGFPLTGPVINALGKGIAKNSSLTKVNISKSALEAVSAEKLMDRLKTNNSIQSFQMSTQPTTYYVLPTNSESLQGLRLVGRRDETNSNSSLWIDPSAAREERVKYGLNGVPRALWDSNPSTKKFAAQLEAFGHSMLYRLEEAMGMRAQPAMVDSVSLFLASQGVHVRDVASGIVEELHEDGALRSVVNVASVNKSAMQQLRKAPPALKAYVKLHNKRAGKGGLPAAPPAVNAVDTTGENTALKFNRGEPERVAKSLAAGAIDFGNAVEKATPLGPVRDAFLSINKTDVDGNNQALMQAVEQGDVGRVLRLLFEGAIDFDGGVAKKAPRGQLRAAFLPVNRVNAKGQNTALMEAVKAGDAALILKLRSQGARDYGRHAWQAARHASDEVKAAFARVASPPSPQGASTNMTRPAQARRLPRREAPSTTTTTTTGTTSTTRIQGPRKPPGTSGS